MLNYLAKAVISGAKPMSSIRSASSSTKNLTAEKSTRPLSTKSFSLQTPRIVVVSNKKKYRINILLNSDPGKGYSWIFRAYCTYINNCATYFYNIRTTSQRKYILKSRSALLSFSDPDPVDPYLTNIQILQWLTTFWTKYFVKSHKMSSVQVDSKFILNLAPGSIIQDDGCANPDRKKYLRIRNVYPGSWVFSISDPTLLEGRYKNLDL